MINVQTILKVSDNSGARFAKCIKIYGQSKKKKAKIGDIILVSVIKHIPKEQQINKINRKRKVLKGNMYKAIIVRTKKKQTRLSNEKISFSDNAIILLKDKDNLLCTRVFGPVAKELRALGFMKIISLSAGSF